ncbi:MAG TPA: hypothetical protein VE439_09560 [Anaerolineae bacterium]|nr:hypothetical protein [Anaerolineae bacterium]
MSLEAQTALHGLFGTIFLLAFAGAAEVLWDLTPERLRRLKIGVSVMVLAVIIHDIWGTFIYQFYRASIPTSPRIIILASNRPWLHTLLMEYKEFVGGFVPILTIAALYVIFYYNRDLIDKRAVRLSILGLLTAAFIFAFIAFAAGAFITKFAPLG